AEGETQVREVVYSQVLQRLEQEEANESADTVFCIHVFGHSLGVALVHDFLFGLFNHQPGYQPGFSLQGTDETVQLFNKWRDLAGTKLILGAVASAASQLPILLLRKN